MKLIFNLQSETRLSVSQEGTLVKLAIAQQIEAIPHPLYYHCTVSDQSILHLIQLLQTETETLKSMKKSTSQTVVSSIVCVLATHLLQQWQKEAAAK